MKLLNSILTSLGFLVLISCGGGTSEKTDEQPDSLSSRDQIRLKQYRVQGAKIYATYCANCHQQDGKGLASLYPPLAGSDYLMEDFARAA
ncbi:MAG: cytochrome c, partial [Ekhidna sp.]|nr:cytochrome c [Ekhidna sp.]